MFVFLFLVLTWMLKPTWPEGLNVRIWYFKLKQINDSFCFDPQTKVPLSSKLSVDCQ